MSAEEQLVLEGRICSLEQRLDAFERPCEEGMSHEHLAFHWRYSEGVAAQFGEIKTKLMLIEEKLDRILGAFSKIMEV